jgi:hypothetical protein
MGISPFEVAEKAQRTYESSFDRRADSPVAVAQATVARSPYADIDMDHAAEYKAAVKEALMRTRGGRVVYRLFHPIKSLRELTRDSGGEGYAW